MAITRINLTEVIKIWDELHIKDPGEIGFCDLEQAIDKVVGVKNDVDSRVPQIHLKDEI